jgi:hypothetical protein
MAEFRRLLAPCGEFIRYERDRAGLDLGLHLYEPAPAPTARPGQIKVWFQVKGIEATTLSADDFDAFESIAVSGLPIGHIQYWYAYPEPVYLVVYVEAHHLFLAEDVRVLVDLNGGLPWLKKKAARGQKTTTLRLPKTSLLTDALRRMPNHRSLRLDGPEFRGRPLGHRLDPLRSELNPLSPDDFVALVRRLLDAHDFRRGQQIDIEPLLDRPVGRVEATIGRLYLTYEWTTPLSTEIGFDPDSDFRLESAPQYAHGDVLVVIHADALDVPRATRATRELVDRLSKDTIDTALIFFNASDHNAGLLGGWRTALRPMVGVPQGLGSLAFNVLVATNVYLEFLDRLDWRIKNFR